jgi:hypothetical protein
VRVVLERVLVNRTVDLPQVVDHSDWLVRVFARGGKRGPRTDEKSDDRYHNLSSAEVKPVLLLPYVKFLNAQCEWLRYDSSSLILTAPDVWEVARSMPS